jgi:hypothetical protein
VKRERPESHFVEDLVETLLRVMEVVLAWVIKLIPSPSSASPRRRSPRTATRRSRPGRLRRRRLVGLCLHITVTYQAWLLIAGLPLRRFWREAREPMVYAVGTNSSLATLPATLQALGRLKISKESSTLGACVGTNLNNDGIVLYEGMAVLFVAQASGIDLSLSDQILASITCIVAAMGVAGVPEAGFVSLALVLNTIGPADRYPPPPARRRLGHRPRALGHQRAERHGAVDPPGARQGAARGRDRPSLASRLAQTLRRTEVVARLSGPAAAPVPDPRPVRPLHVPQRHEKALASTLWRSRLDHVVPGADRAPERFHVPGLPDDDLVGREGTSPSSKESPSSASSATVTC